MNKRLILSILLIFLLILAASNYCQQPKTLKNSNSNSDSLLTIIKSYKEFLDYQIYSKKEIFNEPLKNIDYSTLINYKTALQKSNLNLMQKEIKENINWALTNSVKKEDKGVLMLRKYLGIGKDIFAVILAIIHLAAYQ